MSRRLIDSIAFSHEVISVSTTAKSLTTATYAPETNGIADDEPANRAIISVELGAMRYLTTGSAPDATTGHLISHGAIFELSGLQNIKNFQAIAISGTGSLQVTYEIKR